MWFSYGFHNKCCVIFIFVFIKGCGKTSVGQELSKEFSIPFFDADDFHSQENKEKMRSGTSLNDEDR